MSMFFSVVKISKKNLYFLSSRLFSNLLGKNVNQKYRSAVSCPSSLYLVLLTGTGLSLASLSNATSFCKAENENDHEKPLSKKELISALTERLKVVRARLSEAEKPIPDMIVSTTKDYSEIQLPLEICINVGTLLSSWLNILLKNSQPFSPRIGLGQIEFISSDKTCTLSWKSETLGSVVAIRKKGGFDLADLDFIIQGYEDVMASFFKLSDDDSDNSEAATPTIQDPLEILVPGPDFFNDAFSRNTLSNRSPQRKLEQMGVHFFDREKSTDLSWDSLAGYDHVKELIEDTIINAHKHTDVYDSVVRSTRVDYESNRPTAVLLEGPPGTGKTLTARILAHKVDRPLVVVPLESVVSMWFGESERNMAKIFDICEKELDGAVIFIDEIDAMAGNRGGRGNVGAYSGILSVLLQKIDGFKGACKSLVVCVTNRKSDLDSAMLSRFDVVIRYDLPDKKTRIAVIKRYAKQFTYDEAVLSALADASAQLSCRDIKEACEQVERAWASRLVREGVGAPGSTNLSSAVAPPASDYARSFYSRYESMGGHSLGSMRGEAMPQHT